ncbi:hypothetical protein C900_00566 [Fulvivirga imtechensis AK7]|uniref:Uncharacterized protein n=1 Tax=Fulvivirga imtechensis AK7 TaxID=1237149 RepID=L8JLN7_9BACT|nr:hypothetical protein C900_00566 [Fulvivirga imtechensis AK7]
MVAIFIGHITYHQGVSGIVAIGGAVRFPVPDRTCCVVGNILLHRMAAAQLPVGSGGALLQHPLQWRGIVLRLCPGVAVCRHISHRSVVETGLRSLGVCVKVCSTSRVGQVLSGHPSIFVILLEGYHIVLPGAHAFHHALYISAQPIVIAKSGYFISLCCNIGFISYFFPQLLGFCMQFLRQQCICRGGFLHQLPGAEVVFAIQRYLCSEIGILYNIIMCNGS